MHTTRPGPTDSTLRPPIALRLLWAWTALTLGATLAVFVASVGLGALLMGAGPALLTLIPLALLLAVRRGASKPWALRQSPLLSPSVAPLREERRPSYPVVVRMPLLGPLTSKG